MDWKKDVNLIPFDVILKTKDQMRIRIWAELITLVLVILLALFVASKSHLVVMEGAIADLTKKNQEIEKKINRLNLLQTKKNHLAKKERAIHSLLFRQSLTFFLSEVEKVMNDNVWLTSLEYENPFQSANEDLWSGEKEDMTETGYFIVKKDPSRSKKPLQKTENRIFTVIQGLALTNKDLTHFLERLSGSPSFQDVNLNYLKLKNYENMSLIEFELKCIL
jgi:Tfp pilus assembly protein PilN